MTQQRDRRGSEHPIRVWLIDDSEELSSVVVQSLRNRPGLLLDGSFRNCEDAFGALREDPPPHIILLHVELEGMDGLDAIRRLNGRAPKTKIIVTGYPTNRNIGEALMQGVWGFLAKGSTMFDELTPCIQAVLRGLVPFDAEAARTFYKKWGGTIVRK